MTFTDLMNFLKTCTLANGYPGPSKVTHRPLLMAWASTYAFLFYPNYVVDGIKHNFIGNVYHSGRDTYPWLAIDLSIPATVTGIEIVEAVDGSTVNLEVRVGATKPSAGGAAATEILSSNTVCGRFEGPGTLRSNSGVNCSSPLEGRYLTIQTKTR